MPGYPPPLPAGRLVSLPGRGDMWVWDSGGSGPAVILLHGWTSTAALNWSSAMLPLAGGFRVLAPDHRGHGRGIPTRRFTFEECADDLVALTEQLGTGPAIVAGYSMGGPIALQLWRRHPEAVAGLVLCATAARFPGRSDVTLALSAAGLGLSYLLAAMPRAWRREALTRMVEAHDPDPDRVRWVVGEQKRNDPAALVQAGAALQAFAPDWLGAIDVPTSVVITTLDTTVPPERQWELASAIPGADTVTVAGGHRACAESPRLFVPALRGACRSVHERATPAGTRR